MIRSFKCAHGDEYVLSSVSSEGAKTASTSLTKSTSLTMCRDFVAWNIGETLYISLSASIGKEQSKTLVFNQRPTCHAYVRSESGPDLLVGFTDGSVALLSIKANLSAPGTKPIIQSTIQSPSDSSAQDKESGKCTSVHWVPRGDAHYILVVIASTCYVFKRPAPSPDSAPRELSKSSSFSLSLRSTSSSLAAVEKSMQPSPFGLFAIAGDGVNDSQISPDATKLAVGCKDGVMRILDLSNDVLCPQNIGGYKSYYGAILCVSWSADSRYVAAGSEDDLVTVYGLSEKCPVAHCEGHQSWVSCIAFDTSSVKGFYRLMSVGQDAHVCIWDLELGDSGGDSISTSPLLSTTMRKTGSQVSLQQLGWQGQQESTGVSGESPKGNSGDLKAVKRPEGSSTQIVGSPKRCEMILYEPLCSRRIHPEPISSCVLSHGVFITSDCLGHVKVWEKKNI